MAISSCHCGIIAYTSATSHRYAGCTLLQALGELSLTSLQVDEMDGLRRDREAKRASISALQEEVQLHREQVRHSYAHV